MAEVAFNDKARKEAEALFARYPRKVNALLPVLHLAQRENGGWLPPGWDAYVAELCETTLNHVRGVITFYNMYRDTAPGKHHIMVCTCLPCGLCGGAEVLEHLEHRLGIHPGNTTPDGLFSLEEVQCLAACDKAPLMVVNDGVPEQVTLDQIDTWIDQTRAKGA
ncbi:MAG: NAD(P)H-dependent oxidoreductase subunit E [Gammaproteobacteria bacterium]|nr:NAD(P)H-dependent oxidoreductase subunit E [Gammaproteobacteria bacterium]NIR98351.1 NAD(P)H-dependent oxidoreductase subunit E [Gammaproteobacteria bacterium]NIT64106.1 NAD(P)H-dependent oxidoreductase subunit E [Gammaproteobacteria bacterium]NIY32686.1 NADH-quinone oxidoreductase subunit NuoE [Gammaproteobacteria bacterium]